MYVEDIWQTVADPFSHKNAFPFCDDYGSTIKSVSVNNYCIDQNHITLM